MIILKKEHTYVTKVDLKAKPYNLSDSDIQWVKETINSMSIEGRVANYLLIWAPVGLKNI